MMMTNKSRRVKRRIPNLISVPTWCPQGTFIDVNERDAKTSQNSVLTWCP